MQEVPGSNDKLHICSVFISRWNVAAIDQLGRQPSISTKPPLYVPGVPKVPFKLPLSSAQGVGVAVKNGSLARIALLEQLFEDLRLQEDDEHGLVFPSLHGEYKSRECLSQLFGYQKSVSRMQDPQFHTVSTYDECVLIDALQYVPNSKYDRIIRAILNTTDYENRDSGLLKRTNILSPTQAEASADPEKMSRMQCFEIAFRHLGVGIDKARETVDVATGTDEKTRIVGLASKNYNADSLSFPDRRFWFKVQQSQLENLRNFENSYVALGRAPPDLVFRVPGQIFCEWTHNLPPYTLGDGWHVHISNSEGY